MSASICFNCGSTLNPDGTCPRCHGPSDIVVRTDSNTLTSTTTMTVGGPSTITPQTNIPPHWVQGPAVQYEYGHILLILNKRFNF